MEEKLGLLMFSGLAHNSKRWEWHWKAAYLNMKEKICFHSVFFELKQDFFFFVIPTLQNI